ncbi:chromatin assembly factor 1 subunit A-like isoform X2 [Mercenaria mercenaria]|uniref:chromatin assembly factor 1 subunit A-like isoform X2 n=1 Tax=Mercenaria mercenaria TaxID=6596 RepID=UPI00234E66F4|nr:chromatin assembly factor 1 subunit A-like isoform X2 [Mercenaria mercenaria]
MPVNPDVIQESQLVPPTFAGADQPKDGESSHESSTRTCETCGQFIGQNPLVKRGMIPPSLAEILVPPPVKPQTENKKRKVVTSGRVISGDEMLKVLKEREEAEVRREEEKKKRQIEKESRREQKEIEQEMRTAKRQKKEQERSERELAKLREKEKKIKFGKLAEKKYTYGVCGVRGRVNDVLYGVEWYGCDNEDCKSTGWFHFEYLSEGERDVIRDSLEDEDVSWFCKTCFPRFYEEE